MKFIVYTPQRAIVKAGEVKSIGDAHELFVELLMLKENAPVYFEGKKKGINCNRNYALKLSQTMIIQQEEYWVDCQIASKISLTGGWLVDEEGKLYHCNFPKWNIEGVKYSENDVIKFFYYP